MVWRSGDCCVADRTGGRAAVAMAVCGHAGCWAAGRIARDPARPGRLQGDAGHDRSKDARGIAQLMRLGWFRPVHCKSLPAQEVRALLGGPVATEPKVRFRPETGLGGEVRRTASDPQRPLVAVDAFGRGCPFCAIGRGMREEIVASDQSLGGPPSITRRAGWLAPSDTLKAETGRPSPFKAKLPRSSSGTAASTAAATRPLINICLSLASAQSRAAKLHTVPIAV